MTYFNITFTKDLMCDLLIETPDLDKLYQALPQQLWNLPGPHGRLLQDGEFYEAKIKDNYGTHQLPQIPGEGYIGSKWDKWKDEKELMTLLKQSLSWSLDDQLTLASQMGSLVLVKYLRSLEQGTDIHARSRPLRAPQGAASSAQKIIKTRLV